MDYITGMIKALGDSNQPIEIIQNGEDNPALIDLDSFKDPKDADNLMKIISIGEKNIEICNVVTHEDVKKRIAAILS